MLDCDWSAFWLGGVALSRRRGIALLWRCVCLLRMRHLHYTPDLPLGPKRHAPCASTIGVRPLSPIDLWPNGRHVHVDRSFRHRDPRAHGARVDPGQQDLRQERLGHVVVGAGRQPDDLVKPSQASNESYREDLLRLSPRSCRQTRPMADFSF